MQNYEDPLFFFHFIHLKKILSKNILKKVRSVSVSTCEDPPEKWSKLKSKFEYDLEINYVFDQKELPQVDTSDLQHISLAESEGDNNENEEENDDWFINTALTAKNCKMTVSHF